MIIKYNSKNSQSKKKILCWSDAVVVPTGFGVVSKHILQALYSTGKYEIDQLAINYLGTFYDKEKYPYQLVPASLARKEDPYGNQMLVNALGEKGYDYLFIINDTFVTSGIATHIQSLQRNLSAAGKKPFRIIYYFPIDCNLIPEWSGMVSLAERKVAYTKFGAERCTVAGMPPTDIIYHGADINIFKPINPLRRRELRKQRFGIDEDTYLFINVNRNSIRKNISQTILAFHEFNKIHPKSKLYIHACIRDGHAAGGIDVDLSVPCKELGFTLGKEILLPNNFNPSVGIPEQFLNELYNCADAFITTTCGEGFGITHVEAMAAGIPVIVPNNTSFPETVGENSERGYIYPCKEKRLIDSCGYRNVARTHDIVTSMLSCYSQRGSEEQAEKVRQAGQFTQTYSWKNIGNQWIALFDEVERTSFEELQEKELLDKKGIEVL